MRVRTRHKYGVVHLVAQSSIAPIRWTTQRTRRC